MALQIPTQEKSIKECVSMRKKGLIGVQMSTIAPAKMPKFDVYDTMARLADIGYHCVEISQVPMTKENVAGFRRAIDELGLNVAAVSAMVDPWPGYADEALSNPDDFKKMVDDCHALDCDMMRIGSMPVQNMVSYTKALEFAKQADEYACKLKEHGIDLYYHAHHFELVRYNGQYLLDIIKNNTRFMGFELDTHWIQAGGEYPVDFIKKYAGRVRLLHLKDYRIRPIVEPEGGLNDENILGVYDQFKTLAEFAEVGEGNINMKGCIEAGMAGGAEYFLIEQDDTYGRDPFESLKISHDNLVKMGYADWFHV